MLGKSIDTDVANLVQFMQQLKTLGGAVLVKCFQIGEGYARDILTQLTVEGWSPVGYEGSLYVFDSVESIWVKYPLEKVVRLVADTHDGNSHCARSGDYFGIANHAVMLATDDTFFAEAPIGLATPSGFYLIKNDQILVEPLSATHRQRVKIYVTPEPVETPMFNTFLHETFQSATPGEELQQIQLVQEIAGGIMTGCMCMFQKAGHFYDPFGRAGKGTVDRLFRAMVPSSFVTAVSPFNFDKEYYIAALAGARLNVVGELPENKAIPAAAFKTVIGGDLLTGRHPNHRPISFKNLISSNSPLDS